jgi:hypothetical protein
MLAIRKGQEQDWNLPVLLSAGAAGVKILALPLFAAIWVLRIAAGCHRRLAIPILASAALILPLPFANWISSGCPAFPVAFRMRKYTIVYNAPQGERRFVRDH